MTLDSPAVNSYGRAVVAAQEPDAPEHEPTRAPVDGRRLRTERGRAGVVDAMLSLYEDGNPAPGAAEIAARAGVSERSVFRYFEDLESLAREVIDRQFSRIGAEFAPPSSHGSTEERIEALAEQRVRIHTRIAPVARAALLLEPTVSAVAEGLAFRRATLREQAAALFADELSRLGAREQRLASAALDAATCIETVEYLREHAGLGPADMQAVIVQTLRALLCQPKGHR
ncbi:MAG: TetR/AcrR family transcriptional regulator [Actinobacteria bacterium]|nr:TetR/AcrR family transcriptional regulator [Actinomycetota bacterium]